MSDKDEYNFDIEVQEDILRLMAQDNDFISAASHWVKPEYFTDDTLRKTASFLLSFHEKYQMAPTLGQSKTELMRQSELANSNWDEFRKRLDSFYKGISQNRDYTIDVVSHFAQAQAWKAATLEALPFIKKGDFDKVNELWAKASGVGGVMDAGGYWFFETVDERIRRRGDAEDVESDVIPTGILELDDCFRLKGIGRGEIGLVLAPTNGGKSIALGQFGRRAIWEGYNVALLSFEMSEHKMADRMDAGFTFTKMKDLVNNQEALLKSLKKMAIRFKEKLWINRYPTKGASLSDIKRNLEGLRKRKGWIPDLIILDYAAIVKPNRPREKKHLELQEILEDFRGLCVETNAGGWTAAQANREGAEAAIVRGTHVAGSWDSLGICDYILTVNATEEQMKNNVIRLFLEKNRDGIAKVDIFPLRSDFERMVIVRHKDAPGSTAYNIGIGSVGENKVDSLSASMGLKSYTLKK